MKANAENHEINLKKNMVKYWNRLNNCWNMLPIAQNQCHLRPMHIFRNSICPIQTANRWTCPSRQNYGKKYVIMGTKGLTNSHDRPTKPADCNRFSSIILSNAVNNSSSLCLVNECFKPHFLDLSRNKSQANSNMDKWFAALASC